MAVRAFFLIASHLCPSNAKAQREPDSSAIRWNHLLAKGFSVFIFYQSGL
jgi:hypothetical protein